MNKLKPFEIKGKMVTEEMIEQMEKNELSKNVISHRVHYQGWMLEDAVSIPKGGKRPPRKQERKPLPNAMNCPVKRYFLNKEQLAEVHRKYGKPGQHIKEYSQKKPPIALTGTWGA